MVQYQCFILLCIIFRTYKSMQYLFHNIIAFWLTKQFVWLLKELFPFIVFETFLFIFGELSLQPMIMKGMLKFYYAFSRQWKWAGLFRDLKDNSWKQDMKISDLVTWHAIQLISDQSGAALRVFNGAPCDRPGISQGTPLVITSQRLLQAASEGQSSATKSLS